MSAGRSVAADTVGDAGVSLGVMMGFSGVSSIVAMVLGNTR